MIQRIISTAKVKISNREREIRKTLKARRNVGVPSRTTRQDEVQRCEQGGEG